MKYAVNEEGVEAMRAMASAIVESAEQIMSCTSTVRSTADEYENMLGPHKASLDEALTEIAENVKQASDPINSVAGILNDVADGYEEVIGDDKFKGLSGK